MTSKGNGGFRGAEQTQLIDVLCNQVLKRRPHLLHGVLRHLGGKGVKLVMATKNRTLQPLRLRKRAHEVDRSLQNWMPHCYTRLDKTSLRYLEKLVTSLEHNAFSQSRLKDLKTVKTSTGNYKAMLLEILEYVTGFDVSSPLNGEFRHLPTLISHLQALRHVRGCRGPTLHWPPDWGSSCDGVFRLEQTAGSEILVFNKFTSACRLLSESSMLSNFGSHIGFSDLHIVNNFSENRASIGSDRTSTMIPIGSLPGADGNEKSGNSDYDLSIVAEAVPNAKKVSEDQRQEVSGIQKGGLGDRWLHP